MATVPAGEPLLTLASVGQDFRLPSGKTISVLADINLLLRTEELVAILGPSGCGKSTLIRIAAGLLHPTRGDVHYRGAAVTGPLPHVALVFQQFALFPWLTVAQNIEQVLVPLGVDPAPRAQRVSDVIGLIGLEGFEEAYPRELSGGMKQRVGIARALVVQPELLCMDEPFSQVDALTAETLRTEVVNLWREREKYPLSIFMVSHDIHEVVLMASRILIMSAHPGRIKTVIENALPYPRDPRSSAYQSLVDYLHGVLTGLYLPEQEPGRGAVAAPAAPSTEIGAAKPVAALTEAGGVTPVPGINVREIIGLLEAIKTRGGDVAFFRLTAELGLAFTRILLAAKFAELLGLLESPQDRLVLTELGLQFVGSPRKARRQLFRTQLLQVPLIKRLREMMERSAGRLEQDVLLEELAIQCPQEEPKRLLRVLINWGRFADLWIYDAATASLVLGGANHKRSLHEPAGRPNGDGVSPTAS